MTYRFDAGGGLIVVAAEIEGPTGSAIVRMALDTGATCTLVNSLILVAAGYDLALAKDRIEVTTGSGVEYAAKVELTKMAALGMKRYELPVLAHTLPPSAGVDGLLGIDFFAGRTLTINFASGELGVS
ncbi:MAG TPA: aspartyl protease family protein [Lacipirellula sp.]